MHSYVSELKAYVSCEFKGTLIQLKLLKFISINVIVKLLVFKQITDLHFRAYISIKQVARDFKRFVLFISNTSYVLKYVSIYVSFIFVIVLPDFATYI